LTRLGRHFSETAEIVGDVTFYERAESAVTEALRIDPHGETAAEARTTLGHIRLERGENERALAELRSVIADHPEYAPAHGALAYLFKNTGLWEHSLTAQEAAGRLDPRLLHSIPRLSVLLYQDRFGEAQAESDALLSQRPKYSHFNYWKGIVYFYAGELESAREWIERGYDLDPDNFIGKGVLAFILAHLGDSGRAKELLRSAEAGAAADGTFTYWIAKARAALGDLEGAVLWIGKAESLGYWNAPWIARDRALLRVHGLSEFRSRLVSIENRRRSFLATLGA
jgi:tetratricopeptide (TPR) repeat protein